MAAVIIFCGECGAKIVTDSKHAGRAAVCADCQAKVPIPSKPGGKPQMRRLCPGCGKRVAAELGKAGRAMKCPGCKEEFDLPKVKMGSEGPSKKKAAKKKSAKKKPSKKGSKKTGTEVVPLVAAADVEKEEDEDEILSLLRSMAGSQHIADTDEVDRVEVLDDSDTGTGSRRAEVPTVIDEDLQRADTQGLEPYGKRGGKKKAAAKKGKSERFRFKCPECGFRILVARSSIGKQGRCPDCKAVVTIEEP